jgi:hypothetical protein
MSKKSRPTKTRLKKTSSYIDNKKRQESDETRKQQIDAVLQGQGAIDRWNTELIGKTGWKKDVDLREHFKNIQLETGLVVQMYMENPIKSIGRDENSKKVIHLDWSIRQIDARERSTDKNKWVSTPFPVIDKGVIMAISPAVKIWYHEQKEKLAKYDPIAAQEMIIPEVGDTVYTKLFRFKDTRYYVNKQEKCEDFVMNQTEIRLKHFQNLFLIDNFDIESIVKAGKEDEMDDKQVLIEDRYIEIPSDPVETVDNSDHLLEE